MDMNELLLEINIRSLNYRITDLCTSIQKLINIIDNIKWTNKDGLIRFTEQLVRFENLPYDIFLQKVINTYLSQTGQALKDKFIIILNDISPLMDDCIKIYNQIKDIKNIQNETLCKISKIYRGLEDTFFRIRLKTLLA